MNINIGLQINCIQLYEENNYKRLGETCKNWTKHAKSYIIASDIDRYDIVTIIVYTYVYPTHMCVYYLGIQMWNQRLRPHTVVTSTFWIE